MNANEITTYPQPTTPSPITVMVSAWEQERVTPGSDYYLGVTVTNRGEQDAVVKVRLESPSELLQQWCPEPEQWLALSRDKSGELTFGIRVPGDAVPQWLDYEVVVRPQGTYASHYLAPTRCRLQVLAPEATASIQDPAFSLSPITSPSNPAIVQPGIPIPIELTVENRSERVDRFRLECTGLTADWIVKIQYPRNYSDLGLVQITDSLGINPGDQGTIQVFIQPPPLPLAGNYLPTFRLTSENDPDLGLRALIYLRVEPVYVLQAQLQTIQDQVHQYPAQFNVQFANLGNTARQVQLQLQSLSQPGDCLYNLRETSVTIAPQTTTQVPLEAQPQHWWTRPWFGQGKVYAFRINLTDVEQQPITPESLERYFTWMPRPWWQLLLVGLLALGFVGTIAFLIWWYLLRPPAPANVLDFAAEDNRYAEVNGDMARVRWQIENPQQIQSLKLTGYSPDGEVVSGPLVYDFRNSRLPASLQPFCTQQKTLLSCSQVRSDAFLPGKYIFELIVTPRRRGVKPTVFKTSPVEILAKPFPTVTTLLSRSLVYREAGSGTPAPAEQNIPVADRNGIRLDWVVTMPDDLVSLHLLGRDQAGKLIGDVWYRFPAPGELPEALVPFCRLEQSLICRNVPTGLATVGEYQFELQAIAAGKADPNPAKPKATEMIKIQPIIPQILSFQINGREAPAKVMIPFVPGQPIPLIQVAWKVQGGSTTRVELSPAPGNVPLLGQLTLPLSPQGGTTLALQVKTPTGESLTRSVTLETYNPNPPTDGEATTENPEQAETPAAVPSAGSGAPGSGNTAGSASPLDRSTPAVTDQISPTEQPPQFNRQP